MMPFAYTLVALLIITSVLLTPYPPGIPLLIPGERFNRTIVQFLQFARSFNQQFPGFDTDIHGLVEENDRGKLRYFIDCVRPPVETSTSRKPAKVTAGESL